MPPPAFIVAALVADSALPVSSRGRVGILWRVLVTEIAVRLAEVRAHRQALVKRAALWVEQFLQRLYLRRSLCNRVRLEAGNLGEIAYGVRDAFYRYLTRDSRIPSLHLLRSPSTVGRFVVSVIVDSVYGISERTLAHVRRKCNEAFAPSFADGYSPTTVVAILPVIGVVATAAHVAPRSIERMFILERHARIMRSAIK